jgi:hypothetical protein
MSKFLNPCFFAIVSEITIVPTLILPEKETSATTSSPFNLMIATLL